MVGDAPRLGFCAVRTRDYGKCRERAAQYCEDIDAQSEDIFDFRPIFFDTKLAAITWHRKEAIRKLGGAPSEADKPVKTRLRDSRRAIEGAISENQYVILTLHSMENLAEACSTGQLVVEEGGYRVVDFWDPCHELPFRNLGAWSMDVECLGCKTMEPVTFLPVCVRNRILHACRASGARLVSCPCAAVVS